MTRATETIFKGNERARSGPAYDPAERESVRGGPHPTNANGLGSYSPVWTLRAAQ